MGSKLEIGKEYVDGFGNKIIITETRLGSLSFNSERKIYVGSNNCQYEENGRWCREDSIIGSEYDLIIPKENMEINYNNVYSLKEIVTNFQEHTNNLPFKLKAIKGFSRNGKKAVTDGEILTVTTINEKTVYFEQTACDINSPMGDSRNWQFVEEKRPEIVLEPELDKKVIEDKENFQAMVLESLIRIEIFSRTMKSVTDDQMEQIVEKLYKKYGDKKEYTRTVLVTNIRKFCDEVFGVINE